MFITIAFDLSHLSLYRLEPDTKEAPHLARYDDGDYEHLTSQQLREVEVGRVDADCDAVCSIRSVLAPSSRARSP